MSEYTKQAEQFLKGTGTEFSIKFLYTRPFFQDEKEVRDVFEFTLKNARGSYTSRFGDSIHNTKRRKFRRDHQSAHDFIKNAVRLGFVLEPSGAFVRKHPKNQTPPPGAYDVLACLQKNDVGTFEDFVAEFGYSEQPLTEYPRVMGIYHECTEQYAALRKMFTEEQMNQLQEIV